jgi:hypothetical protein
MAKHYGDFELIDFSEARASTRFHFGAITPVSLPGFLVQFGALRTALGDVVLGTIAREQWLGDKAILSNIPPSNPAAHRELAWLVRLEDLVGGGYYTLTIPTADPALCIPGTDNADFTDTAIAAFITALEDIYVPPDNPAGEVVVIDMILIGRDY